MSAPSTPIGSKRPADGSPPPTHAKRPYSDTVAGTSAQPPQPLQPTAESPLADPHPQPAGPTPVDGLTQLRRCLADKAAAEDRISRLLAQVKEERATIQALETSIDSHRATFNEMAQLLECGSM